MTAPTTSHVAVLQASLQPTSIDDVANLTVAWSESLGSEPIGPLAVDVQLLEAEGQPRLVASQPVLVLFQRFGERLIKVAADAPQLLAVEPHNDRGVSPSETYLVTKFDLLTPLKLNNSDYLPHVVWQSRSKPTQEFEPLSNYFKLVGEASAEPYKVYRELNGSFATRLYEKSKPQLPNGTLPNWNIVWTPIRPPASDSTKVAKVFRTDGALRLAPAESQTAHVAAVLRDPTSNPLPLFGTVLEKTLFAGDSASTTEVVPQVELPKEPSTSDQPAEFRLLARASEVVGLSAQIKSGFLFLIKTLPAGETLVDVEKIPPGPVDQV